MTLEPGTVYWFLMGGYRSGSAFVFCSEANPYPAGELLVDAGGGYTTVRTHHLAFSVDSTPVPEPGTLLLLGVGLAAVAARRLTRS